VTFSVMDIIFLSLTGLLMIRCFFKGFLAEIFSMAAVIFGLLAALFLHKNGGLLLKERFWPELDLIPKIVAFAAIFLIVYIVIKIVQLILVDIINKIKLSGADRFLGIILGFAEGLIVISFSIFILNIQPLFDASALLSDSFFGRLLLPIIAGNEGAVSV